VAVEETTSARRERARLLQASDDAAGDIARGDHVDGFDFVAQLRARLKLRVGKQAQRQAANDRRPKYGQTSRPLDCSGLDSVGLASGRKCSQRRVEVKGKQRVVASLDGTASIQFKSLFPLHLRPRTSGAFFFSFQPCAPGVPLRRRSEVRCGFPFPVHRHLDRGVAEELLDRLQRHPWARAARRSRGASAAPCRRAAAPRRVSRPVTGARTAGLPRAPSRPRSASCSSPLRC
jgi:hypothetical protein